MMGAIVGKLWMMGLQACVLILIVLIARRFLRKYPKIYSYWLWALVGIRLLFPIWIETPFSWQPELPGSLELNLSRTDSGEPGSPEQAPPGSDSLEDAPLDSRTQQPGAPGTLPESGNEGGAQNGHGTGNGQSGMQDLQSSGWMPFNNKQEPGNIGLVSNSGSPNPEASGSGKTASDDSDATSGKSGSDDSDVASGKTGSEDSDITSGKTDSEDSDTASIADILRSEKFSRMLVILYLLGVGMTCCIYLAQYILVKYRVALAIRETENIWLCENVQSPFVLGVFRPRIILPYELTEFDKECVLRHEKTHIRHHDPLIRFAGLLCTCLHWWNPLVWLAVHKMNQDMEMFCDESALSGTTLAERKLYASALLSCAKKQSGLMVGLAFGESNTERRVKNILKKRKGSAVVIGLVVLLSVFCGITLMAAPKNEPQKEDGSGEDDKDPAGQGDMPENAQDFTPTPMPSLSPTPVPTEGPSASDLSATPVPPEDLTPQAGVTSPEDLTPPADPTPQADPTPTEMPPFDPAASYLKISPALSSPSYLGGDVAVYFNEDKQNPQVIVEWIQEEVTHYQVFDWDYNLDYGTPIAAEARFGSLFAELNEENPSWPLVTSWPRGSSGTVLRVILPAAEPAEPLNPFGTAEFLGVGHTVYCSQKIREILPTENKPTTSSASFEFPEDAKPGELYGTITVNDAFYQEFLKDSTAGYRTNGDGEAVFTLTLCGNGSLKQYFEYPGLSLPEQETYPIVMEELSHFTDTGVEYRQFGIKTGEDTVWLGKFHNDITKEVKWFGDNSWTGDYLFFPDKEIGYYAGDSSSWSRLPAEGDLQAGRPYRLEPEDTFDLDGDGVPERIEYRNMQNEDRSYKVDSVLLINGREVLREEFRADGPVADYPYIVSLDGKTYQFLILVFDEHHYTSLEIYQYTDGELHYAGKFEDSIYWATMEDGKLIFRFTAKVYPLYNDYITRTFEFVDGNFREIPQEYYEFLLSRYDEEDGTTHRSIFTAKVDIELYREKDGSETFLLSEGCRVSTVGGDLKEWILLENVDTGETGWIRADWHNDHSVYDTVYDLILPDGTRINCDELFDGLNQFRYE